MISIAEKKDCCGCNACADVCPKGAITFERDNEGFLYPNVNASACVECGKCDAICPQVNLSKLPRNEYDEPKCFASVHKNLAIRFDSTSGGAFSAFANWAYRQNGFVGGAIWTEDFYITQYISDNKSDLPKLRSSKYAQSDAQGFYKAVKSALLTKRPVVVCGTPCQMVALRLFLGKEFDNLYVIDFICRGNNSPLVFRKYLAWHEAREGSKVVYVKPKNKEMGWRQLTTKLVFENGKVVYDTYDTSYFTQGYLRTNAYCRPSCYECKFKGVPRYADISVADFWGVKGQLPKTLDSDVGTSLVMVNNSKGEQLWNAIQKNVHSLEFDWATALKGNPMLIQSLPQPHCNRIDFFNTLATEGFTGVITRYIAQNSGRDTLARKIKGIIRQGLTLLRAHTFHVNQYGRLFMDNGIWNVLCNKPLLTRTSQVTLEVEGNLDLHANLSLGTGFFKKAPVRTSVGIKEGGVLRTMGKPSFFMYGADIEIFKGATLEIGSDCGFNLGATIICANHIKIGNHVKGGRHVTIRDNNGGHMMNFPGYKDSKPVEIGDHVWLCEGCTIMPGVKIGAGAVIGAKAVVFNNVPANTMVMGNPATVVCEQVEWKY